MEKWAVELKVVKATISLKMFFSEVLERFLIKINA
jgi:hypothetical protein